jgi:adenylyl-sulfate kinase
MDNNIVWHKGVDKEYREKALRQKGMVLWFTGLSGSGKSTIACEVEKRLLDMGINAYLLDGDNLRYGLNSDLGFSAEDREENIRRISEVAALFEDSGAYALVSVISPMDTMRKAARKKMERFVLIYVKADIEACIKRDPKGMYKKAIAKEIKDFTGIDAPYEEPTDAEIVLYTEISTIGECVEIIMKYIKGVK